MKILFAVNNDNVSEAIAKKYQREYREILSYKNVYYFNAILRELQRNKDYSRIIISEDLEPFANNNYDSIDKFLFEKYEGIADEAKTINNERIDIILICADRRKRTDNMLVKIYKQDIYNAIIGQDRSIDAICKLIYQPRDKEAARTYYGIQENELGENESEDNVSEAEVENIIAHYARLGKNEDKYIESFNNIVAQYTDKQLRIIIKYLPMHVKAVLEERSPKYQQLVTAGSLNDVDTIKKTRDYKLQLKNKKKEEEEDPIVQQFTKKKTISSVVIPTEMKVRSVQKIEIPQIEKPEISTVEVPRNLEESVNNNLSLFDEEEAVNNINETPQEENENIEIGEIQSMEENIQEQKRGRGRPRKNPIPTESELENRPKRGRGRPRKNPLPGEDAQEITDINIEEQEPNLFNTVEIQEEQKEENKSAATEEIDLFNILEDDEPAQAQEVEEDDDDEEIDLFNITDNEDSHKENIKPEQKPEQNVAAAAGFYEIPQQSQETSNNNYMQTSTSSNTDLNTLITSDRKIVAFVGTTKNGTSFVVNNTAEMLASMGISTAVLDLTKSKNAYYIYTNNEESLRTISRNCMQNLEKGKTEGIRVNNKLTIYAEIPDEKTEYDLNRVLETLVKNYSVILVDTDFETDPMIFEKVQEIYLVQTMDVLTIQPLTAFLRNLKSKGILAPEKLKIVINKSEKIRSLSLKTLIAGMSCYNAPNMTYMTELFNKDNIRYCEIPFEEQNYVKYLDSLVNCKITLNGYTKQFIESLKELSDMVYPMVGKQSYSAMGDNRGRQDPFSNRINDTLNKMKSNY